MLFAKKNQTIGISVIVLLFFFLFIVAPNSVSANAVTWVHQSVDNAGRTAPTFTLATPASTVLPGEVFNVTGVSTIYACANSNGHTLVETSGIYSSTGYSYANQPAWSYSSGDKKGGTENSGIFTNNISLGSYTAPTAPGTYYIYLIIKAKWGDNDYYSMRSMGYIAFTVSSTPAPSLTITPSCSNPTITWGAEAAHMSVIYKNGVLMGSAPINTGSYVASGLFPNQDVISVVSLYPMWPIRVTDINYRIDSDFCWGNCPPPTYTVSYGSKYCVAAQSYCSYYYISPFNFNGVNTAYYDIYTNTNLTTLLFSTTTEVIYKSSLYPTIMAIMAVPNSDYKVYFPVNFSTYTQNYTYFTRNSGYGVPSSFTCPAVNAVCSATLDTCNSGVYADATDTATDYRWSCNGTNGGTNASCSKVIPVDAVCSNTLNTCSSGSFQDVNDTAALSYWNCNSTTGGYNASCSLPIIYTITFDSQSATVNANPTSKTATYNANVGTLPTPPTRAGYTFGGWYTGTNGTGSIFTASTLVTASYSVYAKWTPIISTVSFNSQGGSAVPNATGIIYGATIPLPSTPTKTGYIFDSWNTNSGGTGSIFSASTPVTGNITVYAKWTPVYLLSINNGGGSGGGGGSGIIFSDPAGINCGTNCSTPFKCDSVKLIASSINGSHFNGWSGVSCLEGNNNQSTCTLNICSPITVNTSFTTPVYVPALDCSLTSNVPTTASINTNTVWTASTTPVCPSCTAKWTINGVETVPPVTTLTLNKIFTTVGQKIVKAKIYSPIEDYGSECSAITSVIQSGNVIEQ